MLAAKSRGIKSRTATRYAPSKCSIKVENVFKRHPAIRCAPSSCKFEVEKFLLGTRSHAVLKLAAKSGYKSQKPDKKSSRGIRPHPVLQVVLRPNFLHLYKSTMLES